MQEGGLVEIERVYFKTKDISEEVTSELNRERYEKTLGALGLNTPGRGNTKCKGIRQEQV